MESKAIDRIDQTIIAVLQADGRMSWRELGERVHLSATSVGDRVRRLEQLGIITAYRAIVDPAAMGRELRGGRTVASAGGHPGGLRSGDGTAA